MSCSFLRVYGRRHHVSVRRRRFHGGTGTTRCPEIPFKLADIGEGIAEVEVLQWFVKRGEKVQQFQNVCEVQSDKATVEITSRYDGIVTNVYYEVGEMAKVGTTLIDIDVDEATALKQGGGKKEAVSGPPIPRKVPTRVATEAEAVATPVAVATPLVSRSRGAPRRVGNDEKLLTSPSVRRSAMEHNIQLHEVEGTGPEGRILKGDLLEYIRVQAAKPSRSATLTDKTATAKPLCPKNGLDATYLQQDTVVPLTRTLSMLLLFTYCFVELVC